MSDYTDFTTMPSQGYFSVVRARKGDTWVVLKGLRQQYRESHRLQNILRKEYQTAKGLDHPNIVKYLDYTDIDGYGTCIVCEYADARTLKEYLTEEHTESEKMAIVTQVADALDYIHSQGKSHNNLTPESILVTRSGDSVRLTGFRAEYTDDLAGSAYTLRFLSPELKDGTVAPDGRSDIYSLGAIMRDMNLPPVYDSIIKRCMAYGRSERYADIAELTDAIENGERHEGGVRLPLKKIFIAVIVVAIVAIIAFSIAGNHGTGTTGVAASPDTTSQQATSEEQTAGEQTAAPAEATAPTETTAPDATADPADALTKQITPVIQAELDRIYQPYISGHKHGAPNVKKTYNGLRRYLGIKTDTQETFDQVFAGYNSQKKAQLAGNQ